MKLLRARVENFRLLRDIAFEFATSADRNLTVARAANESGKTTLLWALQWGLFGDVALPEAGRNFRLSPLDTSSGEKVAIPVSVEIDCQIPTKTGLRAYRLMRFVTETVHGAQWDRGPTNVELFRLTASGADPVKPAEAHIRPHLPSELREVFFTDGDRALSFIEGTRGDQTKRVEAAIRSLLGLTVVERALSHTRDVSTGLNQKVRKETGSQRELQAVSDRLTMLEEQIPAFEAQVREAKEARLRLEDLEEQADRSYSDALRKGNREELEKQRQEAIRGRQSAEKDAVQSSRDHANLFRSELLGKHFLADPFRKAEAILNGLRDQGKIPSQTIPVLEEQLSQASCICGESLNSENPECQRRRAHIQRLIDDSRNSDAIQEKVTRLFYSAQDLLKPVKDHTWSHEYSDVFARRQRANERCREFGEAESAVEARIATLPDVDVQQLRTSRDHYRNQHREAQSKEARLIAKQEAVQREFKGVVQDRDRLLKHDRRGLQLSAELEVASDLQHVLTQALETMKTSELQKVSDRMNALFLNMIGADPGQRSIITRAAVTSDFRITVFGRYDHPLDPSQDLNGASRRALTIAFVLALTRVSEVEAPNVIDTPLGMMSGYVKQAVLQLAARQSSQLILFLTHSEIAGCEDILDQYAGQIYTLTNPAHYPKILINNPNKDDARVLLCRCNHRQFCQLCERRDIANLPE